MSSALELEPHEMILSMISLALQAGSLQMEFYDKALEPEWTNLHHLRTEADKAVANLVRKEVEKYLPNCNIYSEELPSKLIGKAMTLVVDEIDGTNPYTRRFNDHFSFCIGLCQGRTPISGVVFAPKRDELYVGIKRLSLCNGLPIRVNSLDDLHKAWIGMDPGKKNRTNYVPYIQRAMEEDGISGIVQHGCASVPLCLVACGKLDAYLATSLEPEDMAAAVVIIRGAGGKVTNLQGKEWQLGDSSILAANPVLHQKLSEFFGIKKNR